MKLWERVIEQRLRYDIKICENQFGYMSGGLIMEVIFLLLRLMKKYIERGQDLHMILIDLEKAYDIVSREIL